jgi:3-hydroxyisobutyrate dehydrogenase-like beta-hydroxyacid dehydrogenase
MSTRIAFIGLGHMGGPMAANLVKAGHVVTGFDLVPDALEQARRNGVTVAESAAAATPVDSTAFRARPRSLAISAPAKPGW